MDIENELTDLDIQASATAMLNLPAPGSPDYPPDGHDDRIMRHCPCGRTGCVPMLMKAAGGWMVCPHCGEEVDHTGVELPSR